jgi:hypothetical protein
MSRILIKVANESSSELGCLDVYGASGICYKFLWDQLTNGFTYLPKTNDEITDIFEMLAVPRFPYRFLPILVDGDVKAATPIFSPPPIVAKELYSKHDADELMALCADCGFVPDDAGNRRSVLAQLNSYFLGRAHQQVEKPAAKPVVAIRRRQAVAQHEFAPIPESI